MPFVGPVWYTWSTKSEPQPRSWMSWHANKNISYRKLSLPLSGCLCGKKIICSTLELDRSIKSHQGDLQTAESKTVVKQIGVCIASHKTAWRDLRAAQFHF